MKNFAEFAFGLLPNNGNSNNPITEPFRKDTGILSYTKRPEFSFVIQTSTDLVEWLTDSGASQSVISQEGDVETVQVVISPTLLIAPKRFVRVQTVPSSN